MIAIGIGIETETETDIWIVTAIVGTETATATGTAAETTIPGRDTTMTMATMTLVRNAGTERHQMSLQSGLWVGISL